MYFPGKLSFLAAGVALLVMPLVRAEEEPLELQQARAQFQKDSDFALRPIRDRYLTRLETLKRSLASKGDVRAAVAVQDEIDVATAAGNETAIRAKMVGVWTGPFKDGQRRYIVKADGSVDWPGANAVGRLLREGKEFVFWWDQIEEVHRVSLTETGAMVLDLYSPKISYPKGQPLYRVTLTRSATAK